MNASALLTLVKFISAMLLLTAAAARAYDAPVDPDASADVKRVLQYLGEVADSDKVLSGQFRYDEGDGGDCVSIHKATGKWPAVLEHYFYVASDKDAGKSDAKNDNENPARRQKMLDYWKNGGLVAIWAKLLVRHSGVRQTPGDWSDVWKPGTPKNEKLKAHFDKYYIPHMKWLQERGVVLIFRAYNEECQYFKDIGDENMKKLWVWTYEYFTETHGLHNIIWFFAGNRIIDDSFFARYPGDQYVDMVGFSNYTIKKPEAHAIQSYKLLREKLPDKVFALAEEGWDDNLTATYDALEVATMIKKHMPRTAYWLSWSGHWSPVMQKNCVELFNDTWVLDRGEVAWRAPEANVDGERYMIADLNSIDPVRCPCGHARRAFAGSTDALASVHMVDIEIDSRTHYHKTMTEIYIVLEGEGQMELDGKLYPVKPMNVIYIKPGCRHRAIGKLRIINVPMPPFDPKDEWFDEVKETTKQ